MQRISFALSAALLSTAATAQGVLGQPSGFSVNVQSATTTALGGSWGDRAVGACRDKNGNYWAAVGLPITAPPTGTPTNGKIVKFDSAGNYVKNVDQPQVSTADPFGIRDLAYDGNNTIYGGASATTTGGKIKAFDIVTEAWDATKDWIAPASVALHRGLAYDPLGNNGNGSMWTCNFNTNPLTEFDKNGVVLRTIPVANLGNNAAPYGIAIDVPGRKLWAFSQGGSTKGPTTGAYGIVDRVIIQIDLVSGLKTGLMSFGDVPAIAGGCELTVKSGQLYMVCLNQGALDSLTEVGITFNYGTGCGGKIGMTGDAPWSGNAAWGIELRNSTATNAILALSVGTGAVPIGPPLSVPGCTILIQLPFLATFPQQPVVGGTAVQNVPIPIGLTPGGPVRFQWIELPATVLPVSLSDGGQTYIGY